MSALEDCCGAGRYANSRGVAGGFCEGGDAYLAYEGVFRRKYRYWRGRSGRSYVFSVYSPQECPAYEGAVIVAGRGESERGGALALLETGVFPEAELVEIRRRFGDRLGELEFQIHVLADRRIDRRRVIDDLRNAELDA